MPKRLEKEKIDAAGVSVVGCERPPDATIRLAEAFTYEEIDFRIPVREGFYNYKQKVEPAYLVTNIGIDWASIVVHRKPGKPDDRWFVSEFATGRSIAIPRSTCRDEAVQHAIDTLKKLGREGYQKALEK